ncbi:MAG TPA: SRPBCC domain-containing protein [Allosphingosinicella sp.]|nr:SRPBCC domain-containing protein [Allosphingosinicella sp.]
MKSFRRVRTYKHSIEDVWAALTDPYALAEWLMPVTAFAPTVGSRFRFQYDPERLCPSGIADCEVIESDPPHRLAWSWQHRAVEGAKQAPPMRVEWTLTAVEGGTRLELVQSYEDQPWSITFAMGVGWRFYLRMFLPKALKNIEGGVFERGAIPLKKRAYKATNLPPDVIV